MKAIYHQWTLFGILPFPDRYHLPLNQDPNAISGRCISPSPCPLHHAVTKKNVPARKEQQSQPEHESWFRVNELVVLYATKRKLTPPYFSRKTTHEDDLFLFFVRSVYPHAKTAHHCQRARYSIYMYSAQFHCSQGDPTIDQSTKHRQGAVLPRHSLFLLYSSPAHFPLSSDAGPASAMIFVMSYT